MMYKKKLSIISVLLFLSFPAQALDVHISGSIGHVESFYTKYLLPQALYPLFFILFFICGYILFYKKTPFQEVSIYHTIEFVDVFCTIFLFLSVSIITSQLVMFVFPPLDTKVEQISDIGGLFIYIFASCIIPVICEEFIFRGVIIGQIAPFNEKAAIFISAILFAFMHGTFQQIPIAFCAGILLGIFYVRHQSILLCMLLHFCNNFLNIIYYILAKVLPENLSSYFEIGLMIIILLMGVFCFIIYINRYPRKSKEKLLFKNAIITLSKSIIFWIYLIIMTLITIMSHEL